jgi:hypothetical protein
VPEFTGAITEPGLDPDVPEDLYHRDPVPERSLSVTSSKVLLEAGGPAKFDYARRHPHKSSAAMDLGTTVHGMVLGTGADIEVIDYPDFTTKKAKDARDAAIAAGKIPMIAHKHAEAQDIADAVLRHPTTGGLFTDGDAEISGFWRDPEFGIWLRGRIDYLIYIDGRPTIVDFKTSKDAGPDAWDKSVYEYGYYRQDPWYREGLAACLPAGLRCEWHEIDFVFAVVETEPPYLVATYYISDGTPGEYGQPTPNDVALGMEHNRIAREKYRDCAKADNWPGYSEEIERLELRYYDRQRIERGINEYFD